MSRVGKSQIKIPQGTEVVQIGRVLKIKGKVGSDSYTVPSDFEIKLSDSSLSFAPPVQTSKNVLSLWGITNRNVANIIRGVSEGFRVNLDLVGVGYRAAVNGLNLNLQLGFSHEVVYPIPEGIQIRCEKPTSISVTGMSKQRVGQVAADIRSYRLPEPYKGKGVIREGEFVLRKEGKKK